MKTGPSRPRAAVLSALLLMVCHFLLRGGGAQEVPETFSPAAFLDVARDAFRTYASRDRAVGKGYRAVGVESPAGGRTWLNTSHLIHLTLDPAQPSGLVYATLDRHPVLAAVFWALPVANDAPSLAPIPPAAWRLVGECEAVPGGLAREPAETSAAGEVGGCLLAARAWIGIDNPAGVFAWENWALPLAREGLPLSPTFSEAAGRAVALASGAEALLVRLPPSLRVDAEPVLERWADRARDETARIRMLYADEPDLSPLAAIWVGACRELVEAIGERVTDGLTSLPALVSLGCPPPASASSRWDSSVSLLGGIRNH